MQLAVLLFDHMLKYVFGNSPGFAVLVFENAHMMDEWSRKLLLTFLLTPLEIRGQGVRRVPCYLIACLRTGMTIDENFNDIPSIASEVKQHFLFSRMDPELIRVRCEQCSHERRFFVYLTVVFFFARDLQPVPVKSFSEDEVRAFLSRVANAAVSEQVVSELYRSTKGCPGHLDLVMRALLNSNVLAIDGDVLRVSCSLLSPSLSLSLCLLLIVFGIVLSYWLRDHSRHVKEPWIASGASVRLFAAH